MKYCSFFSVYIYHKTVLKIRQQKCNGRHCLVPIKTFKAIVTSILALEYTEYKTRQWIQVSDRDAVHLTCPLKIKKMSSSTISAVALLGIILMSMILHSEAFVPSGISQLSRLRSKRRENFGVSKCEEVNIVKIQWKLSSRSKNRSSKGSF